MTPQHEPHIHSDRAADPQAPGRTPVTHRTLWKRAGRRLGHWLWRGAPVAVLLLAGAGTAIAKTNLFPSPSTALTALSSPASTPAPAATGPVSIRLNVRDAQDNAVRGAGVEFLRRQPLDDWKPDPAPLGSEQEEAVYWRDPKTGEAWSCALSTYGRDGQIYTWEADPARRKPTPGITFVPKELAPGVYRILAHEKYDPRPGAPFGAMGLSDPVRLEAGQITTTTVRLASGNPLTVRVADSMTNQELASAWLLLRRSDGLPIGMGSSNFTFSVNEQGIQRFEALPPGDYTLTAGLRPSPLGQPQYQTRIDIPVRVAADQTGLLTVALKRADLTPAEIDKRWPFIVEGRITGADGKPMAGVKLDARSGVGVLTPLGSAVTSADGRYRLRFGPGQLPGGRMTDTPFQAAMIYAHREGFYEQNLCRGGALGLARKLPEGNTSLPAPRDKILLPGKPYQLDFVMLPAASVEGRLVDQNGQPLVGKQLSLDGPTGPCADVLPSTITNAEGKFTLSDVPCGPYVIAWRWLEPPSYGVGNSSALDFSRPGLYEVALTGNTQRDIRGERLTAKFVKSPPESVPSNPPPAQLVDPAATTERAVGTFVPDKTSILPGEPIFVTFTLRNDSDKRFLVNDDFDFNNGSDKLEINARRGEFHITAVDAHGRQAKDPAGPYDPAKGMMSYSGPYRTPPALPPGGSYVKRLFLPRWCELTEPGEYTIACGTSFRYDAGSFTRQNEPHSMAFETAFKLTVLPPDVAAMGRLIEELGKKMDGADPAAAKEALCRLAQIQDERVVAPLAQAVKRGFELPIAVEGLARQPGTEAARVLIEVLNTPGDIEARREVIGVLGKMKNKSGMAGSALPGLEGILANVPDESLRNAAIAALGSLGDSGARPALKKLLEDPSMEIRLNAVDALLKLGEPFQADWVVPIIRDKKDNLSGLPVFGKDSQVLDHATRIVRQNAGSQGASILIGCLDQANPTVTSYYNRVLVMTIGQCGGPKLTFHHSFAGRGTEDEEAENRKTLDELQAWGREHPVKPQTAPQANLEEARRALSDNRGGMERYRAVEELAGTGTPEALDILLEALPKTVPDLSDKMILALGRFDDPRAEAELVKRLDSDKSFDSRSAAQALKGRGWKAQTLAQRARLGQAREEDLPQAALLPGRAVIEGPFSLDAPVHYRVEELVTSATSTVRASLDGCVDFRREGDKLRARFLAYAAFPGRTRPGSYSQSHWAATFEFLDRAGAVRARRAGALWLPGTVPRLRDLPETDGYFIPVTLGELKNPDEIQRFRLILTYLPGASVSDLIESQTRYKMIASKTENRIENPSRDVPDSVVDAFNKLDELERARMVISNPSRDSREPVKAFVVPLEPPAAAAEPNPSPTSAATSTPTPAPPPTLYQVGGMQFEAVFSAVDGAGHKVVNPNVNVMNSGGIRNRVTIPPSRGHA